MQTYHFELFADYFQFYLQDELSNRNLGESWAKEASDMMLVSLPDIIAVGTARNMTVPVTVEIRDSPPEDAANSWDQIYECSIEIGSGKLVVLGCTDYFPDAARIQVNPGTYRARIYYANLASVSRNRLEGEDHYKVALWPASISSTIIIKQRSRNNDG